MKKVLILLFIVPLNMFAQFSLTIEITGLRNNHGQIPLQVYDKDQNKVKGIIAKIENNKSLMFIDNLNRGEYAFKYYHDENKNDILDNNWIGLPIEGYGFSNNSIGTFGPPPFEEWIFELNSNKKMVCKPKY